MKIFVSKAHAERANQANKAFRLYNKESNPVALALTDLGLDEAWADWMGGMLGFSQDDRNYSCSMDFETKSHLIAWDNFEPFHEFSFELYIEAFDTLRVA